MHTGASRSGFTLIELMIGAVIISVIWISVAYFFRTQVTASVNIQEDTELQSSVQAAANLIANDIIMAGFARQYPTATFTHVNAAATDNQKGDVLTIFTGASQGVVMNSFVITGGQVVSGNAITVRCFGTEGRGGLLDPLRDIYFDPARPPVQLLFVDPFRNEPYTAIGNNPVTLAGSDVAPGGTCQTGMFDVDGDGTNDPVANLTITPSVTSLPRGATVYGLMGGVVTYSLNVTEGILYQNATPLLVGVRDFQVRYGIRNPPAADQVVDSLVGINTQWIYEVQFALLVRNSKSDATQQAQARALYTNVPNITTFDHTITIDPNAPEGSYFYKTYVFRVRPKNNGI